MTGMAGAPPAPDPFLTHPLGRWLLGQRHRVRRLDTRRPWLIDSAGPAAVLLFSLPNQIRVGDPAEWLCTAAVLVPLWWRRRAPSLTFFAVAAVLLIVWSAGFFVPAGVGLLVSLYEVAVRGPVRMVVWAIGITAAELTFVIFVLEPLRDHQLGALLLLLGTCSAGLAVGLAIRTLRAYLSALADRTAWLETERDQKARLAAGAERTRVAREMHDLVGHHVSIMIGLADGGAVLAATRGEKAAEPLRMIAETGRQALHDLRRVLGVLRDEDADPQLSPQPGVADLEALLPSLRAAGLTVTYRTAGEPHKLGSGLQLAIYRIVQESLTNTLKHAGAGAVAQVTVAADKAGATVRVSDTGPVEQRPRGPVSGGHGIGGIRERAGLYGGAVHAGPNRTGGWTVEVTMSEEAT
jgi:signal transduction histidine kinase